MIHELESMPFPTVFAAHALCLTAAFEISLACDLLLAAESARFGLVEIVVGLTPSMGGPQRLAERAGPARARELIYTGELYGAATLERWNVVNRVLPDDGFAEAAHAFALKLANGPTRAHAATKAIVRTQLAGGTRAADEMTPPSAARCSAPRTCRTRSRRSWPTGRARRRTPDTDTRLTRRLAAVICIRQAANGRDHRVLNGCRNDGHDVFGGRALDRGYLGTTQCNP